MAHTKVTKTGTQNTGTANTFSYSGSFNVFKASEVEVELDNVKLTFTTSTIDESASPREYTVDYSAKTIHIGGANLAGTNSVVIQPVTDMGDPTPRATYSPGSSVTSADLNNNQLQLMRKAMEYDEQKLSSRGGTMTGNLHFAKDIDITFEGDTDNAYETTLTVADPTSDKTITFPDTTGTVVTTGDTATVTATMLAANSVDSSELVDGSIDTSHIADSQVTAAKLGSSAVTTVKIATDAVTGAKIADDSIDSEHIVDGSVDLAHLSANSVNSSKIVDGSIVADDLASDAVTTVKITDLNITTAKIAADAITGAKIADDAVDSEHLAADSIDAEHYAAGSVDTTALGADAVTGAKIADDAVDSEHLAADSIDSEHYAPNSVDADALAHTAVTAGSYTATDLTVDAQGRITAASSGTIATSEIAADAITGAKIADDAVDSEHIAADSLDSEHYAAASVDTTALASNAVTTAKITDANVTTDKLAADSVTIAKIGCEQTTISNSDSHIPTSGAVVDYVAAQIAPIGGLEVIADEDNFPTSQPGAGVVISISDAAGIVVNGSGVSTTARTAGNGSDNVTINNFPSSLYSETLASGVGLMVSSTGSSNTYNYHKILAAETDVKQLSDDINDFNARYRVNAGEPSSSLNDGDLVFDTNANKMKVYDATAGAWGEVTSTGDFKFLVPVDAGTTTAATFDGSDTSFDLKETTNSGSAASVTNINQLIVSLNGVIQKPNTGSYSASEEGFYLTDADTIRFCTAPATGSSCFIIQCGSAVSIPTPGDGTVTAAKIASGAVTTAKIADANVTQAKLADQAVNEAKLQISNAPTNGYFLSAQSGNTGGLTWAAVNTDLSNDSSPQLGGDLDTNGHHILLDDDHAIKMGASTDFQIQHNTNENYIDSNSGHIYIRANVNDDEGDNVYIQPKAGENAAVFTHDGAVELYHDNAKTFETLSYGAKVKGGNTGTNTEFSIHGNEGQDAVLILAADDGDDNSDYWRLLADDSGDDLWIQNYTDGSWETNIRANGGGQVELYHNNSKRLHTTSGGVQIGTNPGSDPGINTYYDDIVINNSGTASGSTGGCGVSLISGNASWGSFNFADSDNNQCGYVKYKHDGDEMYFGAAFYDQMYVNSTGLLPASNNSKNLGSSSLRWANIYTNDLNLSNKGSSNDVDGTWGDWTIQEGESDLFLKNNRSGKKYKFNLTEVS